MAAKTFCTIEQIKSMKYTEAATNATKAKKTLTLLGGADPKTIGFFQDNVGTSGSAKSETYPNGPDGVFIYSAPSVLVDKITGTGRSFVLGDVVYWNNVTATSNQVTDVATNNSKCGRCLEAAGTAATQVLIDLIVLN